MHDYRETIGFAKEVHFVWSKLEHVAPPMLIVCRANPIALIDREEGEEACQKQTA